MTMDVDTKQKKPRISKEMYFLSKKVGMAIAGYHMLQDKDKIIVAVSGGKDSLTLLNLLLYRQTFVPIDFEIMAVHVDFGILGDHLEDLTDYFEQREVKYHIEKVDLLKGKTWQDIDCFWCSWSRRKALFQIAQSQGFNKIALAHHMDDIVETILLNLFYHGNISAMKPVQDFFEGKLTLIRPLAYIKESEIIHFMKKSKIPDLSGFHCPHSDFTKRKLMKDLIYNLAKELPQVKKNILKSVTRRHT